MKSYKFLIKNYIALQYMKFFKKSNCFRKSGTETVITMTIVARGFFINFFCKIIYIDLRKYVREIINTIYLENFLFSSGIIELNKSGKLLFNIR